MKISGRAPLIGLILGFFLLLGILFQAFILENFVRPVALTLWLFGRFLQVFDQHLCWGVLIFGIFFFAFYRLFEKPPTHGVTLETDTNAALELVNNWRTTILITGDEIDQPNILKRDLGKMLATVYATRLPEMDYFEIYTALKEGTVPLPAPIYSFLFLSEPAGSHRSLINLLKTLRQAPGKWFRHWTGRDLAEYYRSIEEVLVFIDTLMETKHDVN